MEGSACMEMAYRKRWDATIAEMRRVLGGFLMKEECKWGNSRSINRASKP